MILGPLKSSQAGNRLQEKHCVRSANVPASPHHQKPVESSPSRPPRSTLSLLPQLIKEAEVANSKTDDPPVRSIPSSQAIINSQKGFISPDPRARGFIFYTQVHLSSSLHDVHHGLALPEQEDTHEEVQQVVRSLHTCSPGGPVSSYVQRRRTQDRATPRWSVQSGSQQTDPDSLKAVPAQSSSWTHPQHPTQRKEKAAG